MLISHSMDQNREQRFMKIMTDFFGKLVHGLDQLEIKSIKVGDGIILLNFIANHEPCTMSEITEFLGVLASTATRRVDKLVEKGLLLRQRIEEDRRTVYLRLTDLGREVHQTFFADRLHGMRKFMQQIDEQEIDTFMGVIEKYLLMASQDPDITRLKLD